MCDKGGTIYVVENTDTGRLKVGFTMGSVADRMAGWQTTCDGLLELHGFWRMSICIRAREREIHKLLDKYHYRGEWFNCSVEDVVEVVCGMFRTPPKPVCGTEEMWFAARRQMQNK